MMGRELEYGILMDGDDVSLGDVLNDVGLNDVLIDVDLYCASVFEIDPLVLHWVCSSRGQLEFDFAGLLSFVHVLRKRKHRLRNRVMAGTCRVGMESSLCGSTSRVVEDQEEEESIRQVQVRLLDRVRPRDTSFAMFE